MDQRQVQKEGKGTHTEWTDREEPRGESKFWVGSKGNPKYTETSLGAPQKFQLQPRGAVSLCSAPCLPQGEIDTSTWLTGATESRASSAAGRSSASEVGLWEQTAFVAFWEEPQAPARSGSRKTALEVLLVMGSHQGKKRLS